MSLPEMVPGVDQRQGCPIDPVNGTGCYGPRGTFWTVFGTEARFLAPHAIGAVLTGLLLLGVFHILNRKGRLTLPLWVQVGTALLAIPATFLLYAFLFPVTVVY